MLRIGLVSLVIVVVILTGANSVRAQLGGEELPEGVSGSEVYRVTSEMYCEVCQGVPISSCPSATCRAWRQEVANMLGQGYTDEQIYQRFAELYGDEVTGVPIQGDDRNLALGLPAFLAAIIGVLIAWQVWRLQGRSATGAQQAAAAAGVRMGYTRPVPDNVDPEYLERFLKMLDEGA